MRNPTWSIDELIVVLDFYFKYTPNIPYSSKSTEIIELSDFLKRLGKKVGVL